jgi:H+/gluconate symporter-like permease
VIVLADMLKWVPNILAGLTGSASGGQAIALPLLDPYYLDLGVNPEALHRVVSIS